MLEPIIVRSFSAGTYEIISGHRRVEACKELRDNKRTHNSQRTDKRRSGSSKWWIQIYTENIYYQAKKPLHTK
ncbi:MAG: ParB N-terminal domain-containing protein [Acutalibacteraceae bacterium]